MHLNEGEIRTYQDHELDDDARQKVEAHLKACRSCQAVADRLQAARQKMQTRLSLLEVGQPQARLSPTAGRARLDARWAALGKERYTMSNKWYKRIPRPVWATGLVLGLLALALMFAPVRAFANNFLGLFRVQQIQVVQVNPGNLPQQLGSSAQFETMFSRDIQFQDQGEAQEVASAVEAGSLAGISVRLPQEIQGQPILSVQPGGSATATVNVAHVRALLAEIGRADVQIPEVLDGTAIHVQVPAGVLAKYGECEFDAELLRQEGYDPDDQSAPRLPNCTTLIQMPSPTISTPPGLDIQKIGEAYLQVMGMNQAEAEQFARTVDWTSTFVIPMPRYAAEYKEVTVDGVPGTLILNQEQGPAQYLLMWVKDGIVYALTGPGSENAALSIASSLK